jgi:hypothetical protein
MKLFFLFPVILSTHLLIAQNRFTEQVFDQIQITTNIQYGLNATILTFSPMGQAMPQPLLLDFYEPAGDPHVSRPLVLVLAGGIFLPNQMNGLCEGSRTDSTVVEICTRLARMGYAAAAMDYRQGWNPLSANEDVRRITYIQALYRGIQDVRTAIRFFHKTIAEDANPYRIDATRIVVWGESTGGNIALGAAYAHTQDDWMHPSLMINGFTPAIIPAYFGNADATDYGVIDAAGQALFGFPTGDTLGMANWPGYSSDFQLCVSMAGVVPDVPWIEPGEIPAILFHSPNDPGNPCNDQPLILQNPVALDILPVSGSCSLAAQLDANGNNQVFIDANIDDCISSHASQFNGGLEGMFPFIGRPANKARPWLWTADCPNNPNANIDGASARLNLDTVFAYFAPRACAALALCNVLPDPSGLCSSEIKGKVFNDTNQNGVLDNGEQPFSGVVLEIQPGDHHVNSGLTGKFSIAVPPGNYTVSIPAPPTYYSPTNTPLDVVVTAGADAFLQAGLYNHTTANDLQVFLTPVHPPKPGFSNLIFVQWHNVGTTQLSGIVTLTVDTAYLMLNSQPGAVITNNIATWNFHDLEPQQGGAALLEVALSVFTPLDSVVTLVAQIEAIPAATDQTPADNLEIRADTVVGAFDPNDKRVNLQDDITVEMLEQQGNWLDYTIRFQNTGTAPASNVFIIDTLSEWLDVNSLEVLGASHPMYWRISERQTLGFYFDNIQLPDSFHNEPESHGFVRFRVRPQLPYGNLLTKTAYNFCDIYFDFNAPVRTNTVWTTFTETSGWYDPKNIRQLDISPNPANTQITMAGPDPINGLWKELRIFRSSGELMLRQAWQNEQASGVTIDIGQWPAGAYFIHLVTEQGHFHGRFVRI